MSVDTPYVARDDRILLECAIGEVDGNWCETSEILPAPQFLHVTRENALTASPALQLVYARSRVTRKRSSFETPCPSSYPLYHLTIMK